MFLGPYKQVVIMNSILLSVKKRVDGSFDSKWSETLMAKIGKQAKSIKSY